MAPQIEATRTTELVNGTKRTTFAKNRIHTVTLTNGIYNNVTRNVGTVEETHSFSIDTGEPRRVILENLDPTNYVDVGFTTGVYGIRLYPNDLPSEFSVSANDDLFMLANVAACDVEITVISD